MTGSLAIFLKTRAYTYDGHYKKYSEKLDSISRIPSAPMLGNRVKNNREFKIIF
jgi:hypothetical protein